MNEIIFYLTIIPLYLIMIGLIAFIVRIYVEYAGIKEFLGIQTIVKALKMHLLFSWMHYKTYSLILRRVFP